VLAEYVRERLARLLAENRPRRAQREAPRDEFVVARARAGAGRTEVGGPPELVPSDDAGSDARSPDLSGFDDPGPADRLLGDDWEQPPIRRFHRRHLGIVVALLVLGLLGAGWSVLRARPVAIASTGSVPAASGSVLSSTSSPGSPGGTPGSSSPTGSPAPVILVHVLGAVRRPGVVSLPERSRVLDAIRGAGGLRADAAPEDLNLAQVLTDGEQVLIGTRKKPVGEVRDGSGGTASGTTDAGSGGGSDAGSVVDLNRATETQLEALPGIGPVTAGKITAWRTAHGRFSRIEELQEVDGIGPKTYAQLAPHVRV
jgi:competence protein ComEA